MQEQSLTNADVIKRPGFAFLCPVHGLEIEAYCFRACNEALIGNWRGVASTNFPLLPNAPIQESLQQHIESIRKQVYWI